MGNHAHPHEGNVAEMGVDLPELKVHAMAPNHSGKTAALCIEAVVAVDKVGSVVVGSMIMGHVEGESSKACDGKSHSGAVRCDGLLGNCWVNTSAHDRA